MRERRMDPLKRLGPHAFGYDARDGRKDACDEGQLVASQVHTAFCDLNYPVSCYQGMSACQQPDS